MRMCRACQGCCSVNGCDIRRQQDVEKIHQRHQKVKAEAKAEMKNVRSSLNLNLDLDLSQSRAAVLWPVYEWRNWILW